MTGKIFKEQILALKQLSEITTPRSEWSKTNREILLMQIKNTLAVRPSSKKFEIARLWNFLEIFLPRGLVNYTVRPVLIVGLVCGLVFGGWITTVSASYNSLPGDVLYNVKLMTESVQTSLSGKPQSVKLRVEFAGRRVEEVKQIVKSNLPKPQKEQKVEEAVKHLKSDLTQVRSTMEEIKKFETDKQPAILMEVAKVVNQKTNEIQKNLDQTKMQLALEAPLIPQANPVQEQVKQATAMAVETGVKAVEIMVEKHQEDKNSIPTEEVKNAVDNKLKTLEDKIVSIEQQINQTTSTAAVLDLKSEKKDKEDKEKLVEPVKETTDAAKASISQAKDELAKDNLGAALEKIKEGSILTQAAEVKADASKILVTPVRVTTSTMEKIDGKTNASSTAVRDEMKTGITEKK